MSDFIKVHRIPSETPVWINTDRVVAIEDGKVHVAAIESLVWTVRESTEELMGLLGWKDPKLKDISKEVPATPPTPVGGKK